MKELLTVSHGILDTAVETNDPSHIFCFFSGGYDSLMATYVSMRHLQSSYPAVPLAVVHINTGIGIDETRQFVRDVCAAHQWNLKEYKTPESYEDIVLKHGFPGPASHRYMYILLKERAITQLIRAHTVKRGTQQEKRRRLLFVTGVRLEESTRRMGHVEPIKKAGRCVWVAPLLHWTKMQLVDYREQEHLPHNTVVDTLHMSGECLCGSFAKPDEFAEVKLWYPAVAVRIEALQDEARRANVPCKWGVRPPRWHEQIKKGQEWMPGFEPNNTMFPLCQSCDAQLEGETA